MIILYSFLNFHVKERYDMANLQSIQRSMELSTLAAHYYDSKADFLQKIHTEQPLCTINRMLNYFEITLKEWNDWHWQLKNRITTSEQLGQLFGLDIDKKREIDIVGQTYRWAVTPYYLSQIRKFDITDPIYLQCIPQSMELISEGLSDPMNEENSSPAGAITRRYPDRVILNVTNCCASFCRHCQRRRNIADKDKCISFKYINESLDYIKQHSEIRDVLITGGDPLTLEDDFLDTLIGKIRGIKSVEIIRIGTRVLVTLPQRITQKLIAVLSKYSPLYINTQFNHPYEVTETSAKACELLADHGILLGNQMVFLKNVNNSSNTVQILNQLLLTHKVKPYYIFHPKDIIGTKHFSISIKEGLEIYDKLRGNTSGLAIPTYVYNAPNGMGKIPLNSQMLKLQDSNHDVTISTWEGKEIKIHMSNPL